MKDLLKIQQKLIPQVIELMERRYSILRQISLSEPVGRRTLSNILDISERVLTLPLYADLSLDDVDRICDIILK